MVTIRICEHEEEVCECLTGPLTREQRIACEVLKQAAIYRPGTSEAVLRRAAISALIAKGDY